MSSAILFVLERPMHEDYPQTTLDSWVYAAGSVVTLVVGVVCGVRPVDFLLTGQWEVGFSVLLPVVVGSGGWWVKSLARVFSSCGWFLPIVFVVAAATNRLQQLTAAATSVPLVAR